MHGLGSNEPAIAHDQPVELPRSPTGRQKRESKQPAFARQWHTRARSPAVRDRWRRVDARFLSNPRDPIGIFCGRCLFPPTLYYLFIAARKISLLNEFVSNLIQLGLATRRCIPLRNGAGTRLGYQPDAVYARRLITYLQKFEAVYGPLPSNG
jgi:hypothetical protein